MQLTLLTFNSSHNCFFQRSSFVLLSIILFRFCFVFLKYCWTYNYGLNLSKCFMKIPTHEQGFALNLIIIQMLLFCLQTLQHTTLVLPKDVLHNRILSCGTSTSFLILSSNYSIYRSTQKGGELWCYLRRKHRTFRLAETF